jgi:uncharacterized protein YggE
MRDAVTKAGSMLRELGKNLGEVLEVRENRSGLNHPVPLPMPRMAFSEADLGGGISPEIDVRSKELTVEVSVSFAIR